MVDPPHAAGAPVLLLVNTPLQPPLADAVASQFAKAVFTAACVWHAGAVVLVGQVNTTDGEATVTVKLLLALLQAVVLFLTVATKL